MKAAQITSFGAPDVLRVNETDRPEPAAGEVLVAVEAASVNGHDTLVRAGGLKMVSGRRFPIGLGLDFAGTVAATGPGVQEYEVGDRVWGMVHPRRRHTTVGAAEYVALARERHAEALRELGADEVLDYTEVTSDRIGTFDVILDTVGTELNCYRGRLAKGGRMVAVGLSACALAAIAASGVHGSRRIRTFSANPDAALLRAVAEHATSGALRPVIGTVHPLTEIAAAHQAFERGGGMGKHVITMAG
jgi:NADPH:quinone reductase-like Zn-dependent oxidoreductase